MLEAENMTTGINMTKKAIDEIIARLDVDAQHAPLGKVSTRLFRLAKGINGNTQNGHTIDY